MKKYGIAEVFGTIQGEGFHTGTRSVFVRLAGCNMWSGIESRREQDAERNAAECPLFCDTNFMLKEKLTASEICDRVKEAMSAPELIVISGGEPGLQLDKQLVSALRSNTGAMIAVETNGTIDLNNLGIDWICVSPKVECSRLVQRSGNELKVVVPAYSPEAFRTIWKNFERLSLQPEASSGTGSVIDLNNSRVAAQWVMENPRWTLSVQTHKVIGLP